MLKILTLTALFSFVYAGESPYGRTYISQLSDVELATIPSDILDDARLDVPGLITKYGYIAETHVVQTYDGYILRVHRIAGRKDSKMTQNRPVVMLMHALMGSSCDWIVTGPERGLGYILSDQGYDVWLGNARGNYYSRNHVSLDPNKSKKYWNFSFHEIGAIDVPAMIDHILNYTENKKLHYIGHSQGSATFFVMTSSRPEYNDKIISMHAFAPAVYMYHVNDWLKCSLARIVNFIKIIPAVYSMREFFARSWFFANFAQKYCDGDHRTVYFCIYLFFGSENINEVNKTILPLLMSHIPAGVSEKQFLHFSQLHLTPKFQQFDYGFAVNSIVYKSKEPPSYNVSNTSSPVIIYYGNNDKAVVTEDVRILYSQLPNAVGLYQVPQEKFGHSDFMWAINVKTLLYDKVIETLKRFN